jgi:hypothetical protein
MRDERTNGTYPNIIPCESSTCQYLFAIDASWRERHNKKIPRIIGARMPNLEMRILLNGPVMKPKPILHPPIHPRSNKLTFLNRELSSTMYAS